MKFRVVLIESEEGFAVGCPALPGCWSQGATRVEALENIREAAELWLESGGAPATAGHAVSEEAEILRDATAEGCEASVAEVSLAVPA